MKMKSCFGSSWSNSIGKSSSTTCNNHNVANVEQNYQRRVTEAECSNSEFIAKLFDKPLIKGKCEEGLVYTNKGEKCLPGYRLATEKECTIALLEKHLGIKFFTVDGVTDNLYEKVNDNKLSLGCFVYRHPDVGVLLRYNENSGVTQIQALDGVIESPFVISGDHVEVPGGTGGCYNRLVDGIKCTGSITFPFTCSAPTTIAFEAEVRETMFPLFSEFASCEDNSDVYHGWTLYDNEDKDFMPIFTFQE